MDTKNGPVLEMRHVGKRFGGVVALNDVSIGLHAGEILAIVGENGAGKSTLMKILSGSYPATSYDGEIIVNGQPVRFMTPSDAEHAGIEMIYQEISMHLDMSIAENIFLGRLPSRYGIVDWRHIHAEAKRYLEMVGLDINTRQHVRDISTSQQQMVAIARALSRSPRILVLDEPTSALTEREVEILFEKLMALRDTGISCIYITHKMKEVMFLADRITVLRDGRHVSTRAKKETSITRTIEEMVNRTISNMYPKRQVPIGGEILRVENLTVAHPHAPGKMVVSSAGFSVRAGEILGIVGLVGSGRSEPVNAIFGGIGKVSGKVFLKGKEVVVNHPRTAIRHGMALLSEDRKRDGFVAIMDVVRNITLASLRAVSRHWVFSNRAEHDAAKTFIGKLSIKTSHERANIMSLSGGNQQKVVLAKWLMTEPGVLLLDEPTRGIDVGAKEQIYEIMGELAAEGKAIVFVSSELPELVGMCDRFIVLQEGRLCGEFLRGEVDEEALLHCAVCTDAVG